MLHHRDSFFVRSIERVIWILTISFGMRKRRSDVFPELLSDHLVKLDRQFSLRIPLMMLGYIV